MLSCSSCIVAFVVSAFVVESFSAFTATEAAMSFYTFSGPILLLAEVAYARTDRLRVHSLCGSIAISNHSHNFNENNVVKVVSPDVGWSTIHIDIPIDMRIIAGDSYMIKVDSLIMKDGDGNMIDVEVIGALCDQRQEDDIPHFGVFDSPDVLHDSDGSSFDCEFMQVVPDLNT